MAAAAAAAPASALPADPTRVLLTGANGFLGRFLLLDLLQRVSVKCASLQRSSIVVCIASMAHACSQWARFVGRTYFVHVRTVKANA